MPPATITPIRSSVPAGTTPEVVPGTSAWTLTRLWQTVPPYVDDLARDFGPDLYRERMQWDPAILSTLRVAKMAAVADPVQLGVPAGMDADPTADRLRAFCAANLARLTPALPYTLFALLDSLAEGWKMGEIVQEVGTLPNDATPYLLLKAIKPKPNAQLALVADPFNNLLGYLYRRPGERGPTWAAGDTLPPNFLPRDRAIHLAWDPNDSDPRGTSLLRAVYRAWYSKQQMWPGHLAALATFAAPSVWANIGKDTPRQVPVTAADGTVTQVDIVTLTTEQLARLNNGSSGAGVDTSLQVIQAQGVGQAFEQAVDLYNREIVTGILGTTRATQEAQHGSRADSATAQDVVGLLVGYIRGWLADAIRRDVLAPLLVRNFGPGALAYLPTVTISKTEQQDFATDATAIAQLERAGYLAPSQRPGTDARLGLPVRSADETALETQRHAAPPVAPPTPPADGQTTKEDAPPSAKPKEPARNG